MLEKYSRIIFFSIVSVAFLAVLYLASLYSSTFFMNVAAILSVIISLTLSLIYWACRNHGTNSCLDLISTAYLFIAVLGFLDAVSYSEIHIFTGLYGNQVWTAMRYIEGITLLTAFFVLNKKMKPYFIVSAYAVITAAALLSIFYFRVFPQCIMDAKGPTAFNTLSGYFILLILIAATAVLIRNKQRFQRRVYRYLLMSYIFNTLYQFTMVSLLSSYYPSVLSGPCFRIFSVYFMLNAVIEVYIKAPHKSLVTQLRIKQAQLGAVAAVDGEYGVFNRNAAYNTLDKLIKLSKRNKQDLSICYIGLDNYDEVETAFGEDESSAMVNLFISVLKESTRQSDYICRFKEDELLVILPECGVEKVYVIVERIRENTSTLNSSIDKPYKISFSYGLASYNYNNTFDVDSFLRIADYNMYHNKMMKIDTKDAACDVDEIIIRGSISESY